MAMQPSASQRAVTAKCYRICTFCHRLAEVLGWVYESLFVRQCYESPGPGSPRRCANSLQSHPCSGSFGGTSGKRPESRRISIWYGGIAKATEESPGG